MLTSTTIYSLLDGDLHSGRDFLPRLYVCRSHRRQRHLRPPPIFIVFLSISIALLPRAVLDFYLLHTFAEEFTSVVCDPSHRVPHPLIKDCATDAPSPGYVSSSCRDDAGNLDLPPTCIRRDARRRIVHFNIYLTVRVYIYITIRSLVSVNTFTIACKIVAAA